MSEFHKIEVKCPACFNIEEMVVWDKIDASLDPDLKDRLLRKKIHDIECGNCGLIGHYEEPIFYRDDQQLLMIYLMPEEEKLAAQYYQTLLAPPDYKLRLVASTNELNEKIHIFDDALNDFAIEICKIALLESPLPGVDMQLHSIYYLHSTAEALIFYVENEEKTPFYLPVEAQIYDNALKILQNYTYETKGWLKVNKKFAQDLLQKNK